MKEQDAVNQSTRHILLGEEFPDALRLGGTDNIDTWMGDDDWNGIAATGHLQRLSAICGEQLSKQGTVIVSTETLEKPHDFIH